MSFEHPILAEYRKRIPEKVKVLELAIRDVQKECSIQNLQNLRKEVHKLCGNSGVYGYHAVSKLCKQLEVDLLEKMENVHVVKPDAVWVHSLDGFLSQIKEGFSWKEEKSVKTEKKQVVIVDDDADILALLLYEFQELGFEVKQYKTGKEALDFLSVEENLANVSLLVLDRILPDMDGLDILRQIKLPGKVPVLVVSVLSAESDVIEGLQSGAVDYITKPFSVFLLMQKALNLLK